MAKARESWREIAKIWLIRARFPSVRPYLPNEVMGPLDLAPPAVTR